MVIPPKRPQRKQVLLKIYFRWQFQRRRDPCFCLHFDSRIAAGAAMPLAMSESIAGNCDDNCSTMSVDIIAMDFSGDRSGNSASSMLR